eukprot:scaffold5576_cov131-Skeletonema_dohrnii-CCMP3373.AAC.6
MQSTSDVREQGVGYVLPLLGISVDHNLHTGDVMEALPQFLFRNSLLLDVIRMKSPAFYRLLASTNTGVGAIILSSHTTIIQDSATPIHEEARGRIRHQEQIKTTRQCIARRYGRDEFYQRGDIGSAINAYSEALNADSTMVETLIARAACYLDLREAERCHTDCMAALKLSDSIETRFETDEARLLFQKKLLTTLGMAYCLKTENDKALELFNSVLQLDKNDHDAPRNMRYLETLMEVADLKAKADKNFSMGSLEEAKENYSKAEKLDPGHIQVLMNRSAVCLAMHDSAACSKDCDTAIDLLSSSKGKPKSDSSACALANILHPTPCTKRKWQVILLCRRSAAKQLSNDLRGALADLELAKGITSNDDDVAVESIAKDIDDLKAKLNSIKTQDTITNS